jgi:hypothetical protein
MVGGRGVHRGIEHTSRVDPVAGCVERKTVQADTTTDRIQSTRPARWLVFPVIASDLAVRLLRPWWRSNRTALLSVLTVFLSARIILGLLATLVVYMIPEQVGQHEVSHQSVKVWLDVWARWDSEHYLDIARYGYGMRPGLLSFYPLYPVLVAAAAGPLGDDYVLAGTVVSSLCCYIALVYLYKLAAWEFRDNELAGRAVLYMAVYPTALFLFAVYTESLFLMVTIAAFYHARRGEWLAAGVAAALAGLTRLNGVLLVLPLAYEACRQVGGVPRQILAAWLRPLLGRLVAAAAAPLGFALWAGYLAWAKHDLFAVLKPAQQPPWNRRFSLPWSTLATAIRHLGDDSVSRLSHAVDVMDLIAAGVLLAATVAVWRYLPRPYALYVTASTWLLLSSTVPGWPLQSLPRYTLGVFPLFLLFARLGANRHWHHSILLVCAPWLGMYTALFATWYWVF